jgi:gliding motility-associated-like protein
VRFTAANGAGECEFQSDVYQVFIGESSLQCPNAFSPGTSEGVNDEWKVSYKSITEFDCHIFDRHGRQMAHLTHPSQSWDGKRGGKAVPTGVYFYVIKAVGTDGKKYNLSGDINVVGFSRTPSSSSTSTTTE